MNLSVFIPYLIGRAAMSLATTMLSVAIGWHLYKLSGDPFDLALVGAVQIIPIASLFVLSGWMVDQLSRKLILTLCACCETLILLGLASLMSGGVVLEDRLYIFSFLLLHGCARAFYAPAQQAILPNIVNQQSLERAVAITTSVWNSAMTAGPFLAGVLLAHLDLDIYWGLAGLYCCGAIAFLRIPPVAHTRGAGKGWRQVLGGIQFIRSNAFVLGSISLDLLVVLFGSVMALLPIYAIDILGVGPEGLGLLRGMPALGAVMTAMAMSVLPGFTHVGKALFSALLLFSLSIFVFAISTSLWLSLAALWLYGASDTVSVNIRATLIQVATPDELRGRVSAVNSLFIATSNELGDFRAGSVAAVLPPVVAVSLGGVMALGVTLLGSGWFPGIRDLRSYSHVGSAKPTAER